MKSQTLQRQLDKSSSDWERSKYQSDYYSGNFRKNLKTMWQKLKVVKEKEKNVKSEEVYFIINKKLQKMKRVNSEIV